jgi:hypothetical protein
MRLKARGLRGISDLTAEYMVTGLPLAIAASARLAAAST